MNEIKSANDVRIAALEARTLQLEQQKAAMNERIGKVEIRTAVNERDIIQIKDDVSVIKNNTIWIIRLIVGAVVMAALGLVLSNGGIL